MIWGVSRISGGLWIHDALPEAQLPRASGVGRGPGRGPPRRPAAPSAVLRAGGHTRSRGRKYVERYGKMMNTSMENHGNIML